MWIMYSLQFTEEKNYLRGSRWRRARPANMETQRRVQLPGYDIANMDFQLYLPHPARGHFLKCAL